MKKVPPEALWLGGSTTVPIRGEDTQVFKRQTKLRPLQSKICAEPKKSQEILQVDILSGHCSSCVVLKVIPLNIRPMKAIAFKVRKIYMFPDCIKSRNQRLPRFPLPLQRSLRATFSPHFCKFRNVLAAVLEIFVTVVKKSK